MTLHSKPAHRITSDDEAIAIARALADEFRKEAALRDAERRLPVAEIDALSQSGLWGITIPKAYGGAGVRQRTVAQVFRALASGDSSIAQIPQNHFEILELVRQSGSDAQKQDLFGLVLAGARFGNAFSEFKGKTVEDFQTRIRKDGDAYVVQGEKFYSTGALYAHLIPVVAISEDDGRIYAAFADRHAPGLTVVDNWSGFGQRTTASGTVILDAVRVAPERVLPAYIAYEKATAAGPLSQLLHSAIDLGLAERAIDEAIDFVRTKSRPWIDSGQARASDDPFTIQAIGDLKIRMHAADALLALAGDAVDEAIADPTEVNIALAKVKGAEAKVLTTEVALQATNRLFELAGTRSVLSQNGLDRLWRDARTHTLHDPVRWKFHAVGNYYLNAIDPPAHSWI